MLTGNAYRGGVMKGALFVSCLRTFEPNYTMPPQRALVEVPVTIRGSLEVPRLNYDHENLERDLGI